MRVLHVHSGNLYGGVEALMVTMARSAALNPALESEFALCFDARVAAELRAAGATVHPLGHVRTRYPLSIWRARRRLRQLLARRRFDVAVCHMPWAQAMFAHVARTAGLPVVFWMHGAAAGRHWLERWARHTPPDLALCNSRFTATTLAKLYPHSRSEVFYMPVASVAVRMNHADRETVRTALDTPPGAVVIIQVSRMEPGKGHMLHLEALARLRGQPEWTCWFVGGAQRPAEVRYLEQLRMSATRLGIAEHVRFLGQRADVPRLLAAADILCQPNTGAEAFGIVFVEAEAAGLPVVATALGGALEVIDESCGVLVAADDVDGLAAALHRLISDGGERHRIGAGGPANAKRLCDPATQMGRLAAILATVASTDERADAIRASVSAS
ncbi:MAG: glycosyltransferase [Candidatus Binataceae bacterium]